jgi:hypothetical protein
LPLHVGGPRQQVEGCFGHWLSSYDLHHIARLRQEVQFSVDAERYGLMRSPRVDDVLSGEK